MKSKWFRKDESFVWNSASDLMVGFAGISWLIAAVIWEIARPTGPKASWEAIGLPFVAGSLVLSLFLTYSVWAMWTGREKWFYPEAMAARPLTSVQRWLIEFHPSSPPRPRVIATGAIALVVGLPLLVIGSLSLGWRAMLCLATLAAYGSSFALMAFGMAAVFLNARDSARAPRWLSTTLLLCAVTLTSYPGFWTPTVWNCFGVRIVEPALIH